LIRDEKGYTRDYIILDVNSQFEHYTDITAEEIICKNASEIVIDLVDDFTEWVEMCVSIVVSGASKHIETFDPLLQRWFRIVIYKAGEDAFVTLFEDFTAEKVREELFFEKFQQDQEFRQLRRLVNRIPVIVCEFSDNLLLKYVNRSFCEYFSLSNQELLGRDFFTLMPEPEQDRLREICLNLSPESPIASFNLNTEGQKNDSCSEWRIKAVFPKGRPVKYYAAGCAEPKCSQ